MSDCCETLGPFVECLPRLLPQRPELHHDSGPSPAASGQLVAAWGGGQMGFQPQAPTACLMQDQTHCLQHTRAVHVVIDTQIPKS